ncbi:MAG: hypothetical protein OEZ39_16870 [Gammaproteobacteria bacterium]|nr:hypothetical protein [Gammaproteobacteria bacterium]MDH5653534.1 hypothetical protein [Gammaproteobacteria bacterium]
MFHPMLNRYEETLVTTLNTMLHDTKWCLYLSSNQNIDKFGGLLPSLVIHNIPGEQVLTLPLGQDHVVTLGDDEDAAFARIDLMNEAIGHDYTDVVVICNSAGLDVYVPNNLWQGQAVSYR